MLSISKAIAILCPISENRYFEDPESTVRSIENQALRLRRRSSESSTTMNPSNFVDSGDAEDGEKTKKTLITHSISFILLIGLFRAAKVLAENSGYGGTSS